MSQQEKACRYFQAETGYNCAQSVFLPFAESMGIPQEQAMKLAAAFGGGVAVGQICGALCGAAMALSYAVSSADPKDTQAKQAYRTAMQQLAQEFEQTFGSLQCQALKARDAQQAQTEERPCMKYVSFCAERLETLL